MKKPLENKVALITGGSRGIGAGIARRLAAEGMHVAFTHSGKHPNKAQAVADSITQHNRRALALEANNENPQAVTKAVAQTLEAFGQLDVLVNNAGIYLDKSLEDCTLADFDQMMAVNVRAVFLAIHAASRVMPAGGRIITIGSNMADRVAAPRGSLYAMSKSALIGLTKGVARDLGAKGITVNLVQPGPVDTDMNPANSNFAPLLKAQMAIPNYGTAADVAGLVAYLASEESRFVTGAMLTIDGGFSI